jgi:hypothetical protein
LFAVCDETWKNGGEGSESLANGEEGEH